LQTEGVCYFDKFFTKSLSSKSTAGANEPTPRGMSFSSCGAVHHQLSAVAQSYSHVQCFLAKGSYRTFGELCYFDYWSSRLGMILQLF
jgi:hypothetical protein